MKRSTKWFLVLMTLVLCACAFVLLVGLLPNLAPMHGSSGTVLAIDLEGSWPESDPAAEVNALFGVDISTLPELIFALDEAARDDGVAALELDVGHLSLGWARAQEIRDALLRFQATGKPIHARLEFGNDGSYYLASIADHVTMPRTGTLLLDGISAEVSFYGGTLAKVGVRADLEQIGEYKSAADVMKRSEISDSHRESMDGMLDSLYGELVSALAESRGRSEDEMRNLISSGPYTARQAHAANLIDGIAFESEAKEALDKTLEGRKERVELDDYLRVLSRPRGRSTIAVVNCVGTIMPGRSQNDLFGGTVMGSDTIARAIRQAHEDDGADAIVLRVNSPGGSPLASDIIWHAVSEAQAAGVPVVASMSDVAASGGYWIAMGTDAVVAQPSTITGSIGIYGGKYVTSGLNDFLEMEVVRFDRGTNSGIETSMEPYTDAQRDLVQRRLRDVYDIFLEKTAEGRGFDSSEAVDAIARGRVWTGREALKLGLVDHLGGLREALVVAAELAKLPGSGDYKLRTYPRPPTLMEMFVDGSSVRAAAGRALVADMLAELPAQTGQALQDLRLANQLQREGALVYSPLSLQAR